MKPQMHGTEPTVRMESGGKVFGVDASVADIVRALNDAGLTTVASCSGHGHMPGRVSLADGRELFIAGTFEMAQAVAGAWPVNIHGDPKAAG